MIYREICNSVHGQQLDLERLSAEINAKEQFVMNARTPFEICNKYIDTLSIFNTTNNKKRKQAEKELNQLTEQFRYIKDDAKRVEEWNEMKKRHGNNILTIDSTQQFIANQTNLVCNILREHGFITVNAETNDNELTELGIIASNIAEIHPLITCKLLDKWNYFHDYSARQIVGLFSCFTDVKVQDDCRVSVPTTDDSFLKQHINELSQLYQKFAGYECEYNMHTGIDYENSLQYDMIDLTMAWCDCQSIEECKLFIQTELTTKSISIGDFTKAMLKVVTIVKEWMNVFELIGNIEALHKFTGIDSLLLKYVTTSQSLYV